MANVTVGRNAPSSYDIRMDRLRTQAGAPSSVSAGRAAPGGSGSGAGGVGGLVNTLGQSSVYASLLNAGANAWTGFRKTPQGQLFTDRVGEALSAPARLVNSLTGGQNPLSSSSGGVRLGQYNPPGFDPSKPVTGSDLVQSAQAVSKYFPKTNTDNSGIADRAYAAEKERARQLTEQDPLFKKYQVAELSKQYNAATGDEREKIGMQIWAQTNPQLAAKMKPGQTGYSDVSTAFQNLSPITGIIGKMPASSFAMPAASAMPGIEMNYGATAPQVAMAGFNPATAGSAVALGAFSEKSPVDITAYLKSPVEANAKFANLDQTQLGLLRQAYNQRIK
jgi:hypothetical protein